MYRTLLRIASRCWTRLRFPALRTDTASFHRTFVYLLCYGTHLTRHLPLFTPRTAVYLPPLSYRAFRLWFFAGDWFTVAHRARSRVRSRFFLRTASPLRAYARGLRSLARTSPRHHRFSLLPPLTITRAAATAHAPTARTRTHARAPALLLTCASTRLFSNAAGCACAPARARATAVCGHYFDVRTHRFCI